MKPNTRFNKTPLARLAGGLCLLGAAYSPLAMAATITVDEVQEEGGVVTAFADGFCSLNGAIINANTDTKNGDVDCEAGSGNDTIELPTRATFTLLSPQDIGGPFVGDTGLPIITSNLTIEGNGSTITRSSTAVKFRILTIASPGVLTLNKATVSGGDSSDNTGGGGISLRPNASLTLNQSTVSGNVANSAGGIDSQGTLTISNSTISGNSADTGLVGGIVVRGGSATISNSTITGNSAFGGPGGLESGGDLTLSNSIVAGNSALTGGVAELEETSPGLKTTGVNVFGHSGLSTGQDFSFVPGPNDRTATQGGTHPTPLGSILNTTLADNGGPTQTHALVAGSPAVNAAGAGATETDQRGFVKAAGDTQRDVGAFELNGVPPSPPAMAVEGACGEADSNATSMAPTGADLCSTGTATAVAGINGAWGWMCEGSNGGETANCSAPYANQTITLAADPTDILVGETSAVVASSTSGLLPVVTSTTTDVCSIQPRAGQPLTSTVIATGVRAGTCTVLANHPGTGDNGTARFLAATQQSKDITVTAAPVAGGSACDAFTKGENVNVIDLRTAERGVSARGVSGKFNVIYGSPFADSITGGNAGNCIDGGAGNDRLTAGGGNNSLYGGDGNDTLTPGTGHTDMDGGEGTDRCGRTSGRATATRTSCELN